MNQSPVTWGDALQQVEFHKEVHGWICAIADELKDDNCLFGFLQRVPWNMRRNLYNILVPRLSFKPKPFYLYASKLGNYRQDIR